MGSAEGLTPEQVEARRNMVTSLVAGIAAAAGGDAATAGMAATLETSQNWGFLAPVAAAAAAKCATTTSCQRVVTVVSEKSTTLWMQTKDGVTYVVTAAMSGIAAGALGPWAAELVSDIAGKEAALPGKAGSVVHVTALPPSIPDEGKYGPEIPVLPADPAKPVVIPGRDRLEEGGELVNTPNDGPIIVEPIFSIGKDLQQKAENLGYGQRISPQKAPFNSHGQPVFWNGKNYITPDVDGHNVSEGWKMFDRRGNRIGTYDKELNWVKK